MTKSTWSKKDIDFLIRNYPTKGKMWCAEKLKRSEGSVRDRASVLSIHLVRDSSSEFFKEFQKRAAKSKIGTKRPEHSNVMKQYAKEGRLPAFKHVPKTIEQKHLISERNKKWIKENGHPRGMLGKKQSEKSKKISAINFKNSWLDPKNTLNTAQYRQMLSDRATEQHKNGFLNHGYSRGKMGHYDINGKDIFFRSLWEANYALYLDFLIKRGEIKNWEFEVDTFWFENIKRGVRSYKPDFKVTKNDNTIEYHEVKGWMDKKSATKLKRMAKYYPETKLILIEKDSYNDIKSKLGKLLKFY